MNGNAQDTKLVILDRDGVINQDSNDYIKTPEVWISIPDSIEAITRLNYAGYRVIVATNQSGLGRGHFNIDAFNAHCRTRRELLVFYAQIEAIFLCPHAPDTNCRCRKPLPGLFEDIEKRLRIDMARIPVIGDSFRDVQAAVAVDTEPSLVLTGKGQSAIREYRDSLVDLPIYKDLLTIVDTLLTRFC